MMIPGETILSGASPFCPDCGKHLTFQILHSSAGYFIGTACCCGIYTRESHYYPTSEEATTALSNNTWKRR